MSGSQWPVAALLAFGAPAEAAEAQKVTLVGAPPVAFEFAEVSSSDRADNLVALGSLVKIHLFPTELGGEDDPRNIAYVTPDAAERRAMIVGKIRRLFREHRIDELEVLPEYRGDSLVPARIRFRMSHSRGGKPFEEVVAVW